MNSRQLESPNLKQFLKVELHRHLEGSLRLKTLTELATKVGIEVPVSKEAQAEKFLVKSPLKNLHSVLNKFWMTQSVLNSEEILTRITYEVIEDAYNEGIRILELRYSPTFIQKGHDHLKWETILRAIVKGVTLAEKFPISVGLLCTIQRILPVKSAEKVCDFALENRDSFIGLDLADDEDFVPANFFKPVFEKAIKANFPITIHAGESNTEQAPQNVIDAIENLGARRIGHGVQISKSPRALAVVIKNRIPLEICVTSNWLTHAITDLHSHPIRQLIDQGVLVTLNSDDPGIFDIDLTNEYQLLYQRYGFNLTDFDLANDIAAQASFIPLFKKQRFWPRPIHII